MYSSETSIITNDRELQDNQQAQETREERAWQSWHLYNLNLLLIM